MGGAPPHPVVVARTDNEEFTGCYGNKTSLQPFVRHPHMYPWVSQSIVANKAGGSKYLAFFKRNAKSCILKLFAIRWRDCGLVSASDECGDAHNCSQLFVSTAEGFSYVCKKGWTLQGDGRSCVGESLKFNWLVLQLCPMVPPSHQSEREGHKRQWQWKILENTGGFVFAVMSFQTPDSQKWIPGLDSEGILKPQSKK